MCRSDKSKSKISVGNVDYFSIWSEIKEKIISGYESKQRGKAGNKEAMKDRDANRLR